MGRVRKCAKCGSRDVARIMYGLPNIANKRLQERLSSGKIVLGGCCLEMSVSPSHYCNECQHEWGVAMKAHGVLDDVGSGEANLAGADSR